MDGFVVSFPHPLVGPAGVAELVVGTLFGDPAVVEQHDLVDLVEPVTLVGDEQDGAALGGLQQVRGERPAGFRVEVGGGLVEDQQRRAGEERAGQREALPFAAGNGCTVGADRGIQAPGKRPDPGQQPGARGGGFQFFVGGAGAGQPQVVAEGGVEQVRVLRASADHRPDVVGRVAGQVAAVEQGGAAAELAESHQYRGQGGLAGPVGADQRDPPPGRQFEGDPVQGRGPVRLVTDGGVAQRDGERPGWQGTRSAWFADGVGGVGDGGDPGRGYAGLVKLDGGGRQRRDGLE